MAVLKDIWQNMNRVAFLVCLVSGIFLMVVSLFLPPKGAIDPSVIAGIGELLGFSALGAVYEGIEKGHKVTMQHGSTQVTVGRNKHADGGYEHGGDYENEINGEREN